MKKIAFVLGNEQGNGGIARVVSILASELSNYYDVSVISYCPAINPAGYSYDKRIKHFQIFSEQISMTKALILKGAIHRLRKLLKQNDIDVLICCGELYFPLGVMSVIGSKVKCFCWEHSNPTGKSDHKFQMVCRKIAVRKAQKVIVLTKAAESTYLRVFKIKKEKLCQIYNPIAHDVACSTKYDSNSKKIISVGRLSYQKNFEMLLEIAKDVVLIHNDWHFDIYGEGNEREPLERKIKEYNLGDYVSLKGQSKNLYELYQHYSFLVMTSRYEGFPMTLLEAGINGLPLLAFDVPTGPSEIILDGYNGFLINNGMKNTMIDCVCKLIDSNELREKMSTHSIEVANSFNLDSIVHQWREIL